MKKILVKILAFVVLLNLVTPHAFAGWNQRKADRGRYGYRHNRLDKKDALAALGALIILNSVLGDKVIARGRNFAIIVINSRSQKVVVRSSNHQFTLDPGEQRSISFRQHHRRDYNVALSAATEDGSRRTVRIFNIPRYSRYGRANESWVI